MNAATPCSCCRANLASGDAAAVDPSLCPVCDLAYSQALTGTDPTTCFQMAARDAARARCIPVDATFDSGVFPLPLAWELDYEPTCSDPNCGCEFSAAERAEADEIADAHTIECPTCDGHGDVPSGRYSEHNPTGLVECPRCGGDRYVTCDTRGEGPHVAYDLDEIAALRAEAV